MFRIATYVVRLLLRPLTRRIELLIAAAIVVVLFGGKLGINGLDLSSAFGWLKGEFSTSPKVTGQVVKVIDGDTIKVSDQSGKPKTVRMALLDTPEKSALRFGHAECGGKQAASVLKKLVAGERVRLTRPSSEDTDKYGRLVREVWLGGRSIDQMMVRRGWAKQYTVRNSKVNRRIAVAASRARNEKLGVWQLCGGFGR